jgi:hypothetical protein
MAYATTALGFVLFGTGFSAIHGFLNKPATPREKVTQASRTAEPATEALR